MKPRHLIFIIISLLMLSTVAAVFQVARPSVSSGAGRADTPTIGGHQAPEVTIEHLLEKSDLVVLGEIMLKSSGLESCCQQIATRISSDMPPPVRRVDTLTFNVQDTLKGSSSSELTIKVQKPGGNIIRSGDDELALLEFDAGQVYLLFLVERDGHYLIQGVSKGRWIVNEGMAEQTGTGVTYDPAQLREMVVSSSQ